MSDWQNYKYPTYTFPVGHGKLPFDTNTKFVAELLTNYNSILNFIQIS